MICPNRPVYKKVEMKQEDKLVEVADVMELAGLHEIGL